MIKNCAWVDGSFNPKTGIFGGGGVLFDQFGNRYMIFGSGRDPELAKMRNVAGEILGAELIAEVALKLGMETLKIYHDYDGIAHWVTGKWRTHKKETEKYKKNMLRIISQGLKITFKHVKAHTGVEFNELADQMAKLVVGIDI